MLTWPLTTFVERLNLLASGQSLPAELIGAHGRDVDALMALDKQNEEMLEVACLEDNNDLEHLRDVRDEYRRAQGNQEE